jgi:dihydroxyacetone kinase-like predicted kinase
VQQEQRERRLSAVPDSVERAVSGVVVVVAGDGNKKLFESVAAPVGPIRVVEGGQTANPSTAELLAAIQSLDAEEVILLPNNSNVRLAAEQAARNADRPVELVATDSIPAGLAALVSFDGSRNAAENAADMRETVAAVAEGEVTLASRDVQLNGVAIRNGEWLGLAGGDPVAGGEDFVEVTLAVVDHLLREPRSLLTLLTGENAPPLGGLLDRIGATHPEVEVEVHDGGQPYYPLLIGAE